MPLRTGFYSYHLNAEWLSLVLFLSVLFMSFEQLNAKTFRSRHHCPCQVRPCRTGLPRQLSSCWVHHSSRGRQRPGPWRLKKRISENSSRVSYKPMASPPKIAIGSHMPPSVKLFCKSSTKGKSTPPTRPEIEPRETPFALDLTCY